MLIPDPEPQPQPRRRPFWESFWFEFTVDLAAPCVLMGLAVALGSWGYAIAAVSFLAVSIARQRAEFHDELARVYAALATQMQVTAALAAAVRNLERGERCPKCEGVGCEECSG